MTDQVGSPAIGPEAQMSVEQASRHAERIIAEATAAAERLRADAQVEADQMRDEARRQAHALLNEMGAQLADMGDVYREAIRAARKTVQLMAESILRTDPEAPKHGRDD